MPLAGTRPFRPSRSSSESGSVEFQFGSHTSVCVSSSGTQAFARPCPPIAGTLVKIGMRNCVIRQ